MAKKNSKQTKIKHRFGAFEIRISDAKVEIEDYIRKVNYPRLKHVGLNDSQAVD
jgi:hypothetical protein